MVAVCIALNLIFKELLHSTSSRTERNSSAGDLPIGQQPDRCSLLLFVCHFCNGNLYTTQYIQCTFDIFEFELELERGS